MSFAVDDFRELLSIYVYSLYPLVLRDGIYDLIELVPDHFQF